MLDSQGYRFKLLSQAQDPQPGHQLELLVLASGLISPQNGNTEIGGEIFWMPQAKTPKVCEN